MSRTTCNPKTGYGHPPTRFWRRVNKDGPLHPVHGRCWLWTGSMFGSGYGQFCIHPRTVRAHRYSWELHKGEIEDGKIVMHKCDNRSCVNPDHLFLGTTQDNIDDMMAKGRDRVIGVRNGRAVLTEDQVKEIRLLHANRTKNYGFTKKVAELFGVSHGAIQGIVHGRKWKHL